MKKVLVGCPTSDHKAYCLKEYIASAKSLTYPNYDILLVDNSKTNDYFDKIKSYGINVIQDKYQELARDRIINSRNIIRDFMLKNNYDYFLSLEQDVIPPRDVIERLMSHKKEIVSGVVCQFKDKLRPMVYVPMDENEYKNIMQNPEKYPKTIEAFKIYGGDYKQVLKQLSVEDVEPSTLLPNIMVCSLSCVLISHSVLEKVKFRYVKNEEAFDDVWFCKDARNSGFKIYCDTSIKCKHLIVKHQNWSNIKK